MAILCIQTLPPGMTLDQVQAITKDAIAAGPPAGGISHAVIVDGGQVKIFDVWESEEAMNTFTSERLVPAIQKQMAAMGGDPNSPPPMPEVQVFEAHDVMVAA
jgi:hypothetical protein